MTLNYGYIQQGVAKYVPFLGGAFKHHPKKGLKRMGCIHLFQEEHSSPKPRESHVKARPRSAWGPPLQTCQTGRLEAHDFIIHGNLPPRIAFGHAFLDSKS